MRNICFCVSTELLIVQGKGYFTAIQTCHNENPSLAQPVELPISIRSFLPPVPFPPSHPSPPPSLSLLTLIPHAFVLPIVLMLHLLSRRLRDNACAQPSNQGRRGSAAPRRANTRSGHDNISTSMAVFAVKGCCGSTAAPHRFHPYECGSVHASVCPRLRGGALVSACIAVCVRGSGFRHQ